MLKNNVRNRPAADFKRNMVFYNLQKHLAEKRASQGQNTRKLCLRKKRTDRFYCWRFAILVVMFWHERSGVPLSLVSV